MTPIEDAHALDVDALRDDPTIEFYSARDEDGTLLGVGALRWLDDRHAELKSMHTAEQARGRGVARLVLDHLVEVARDRGATRVSLETGSMEAFAPARTLYEEAGFTHTGPYGDYEASPNNVFMTMELGTDPASGSDSDD